MKIEDYAKSSSITSVIDFFGRSSIGFFLECAHTALMDYPFPVLKARGLLSGGAVLSMALLVAALSLKADARFTVGAKSAAVCYCHCGMSKARGGCAKICEMPKYASRWWATSCARPRRKAPVDNPGASPRLPHPDRAEHAQL